MRRMAALISVLVVAGACSSPSVTLIPEAELPDDVYGSPEPTPVPEEELPRKGTVYMVRRERLVAVPRTLQGVAASLPEALMLALLQGPREVPVPELALLGPQPTQVELGQTVAAGTQFDHLHRTRR